MGFVCFFCFFNKKLPGDGNVQAGLRTTDLRRVLTGIRRRFLAEFSEHSLTTSE